MLKQRFREWRQWGLPAKPNLLKTFTDGKNHETVLIESAGRRFVVKRFAHSFDIAITAQNWAVKQGLAPEILHQADGLAVMQYVKVSANQVFDVRSLAHSLRKLHTADLPIWNRFDLLAVCEQYLQDIDPPFYRWYDALRPVLTLFIDDKTPFCACHNDLVKPNCLFEGNGVHDSRAWFIDWEYAMLNNPWFDLASVLLYFELGETEFGQLLGEYFKDEGFKVGPPFLIAAQIAVLWCDLLWHLKRKGNKYHIENRQRFEQLQSLAQRLSVELPSIELSAI